MTDDKLRVLVVDDDEVFLKLFVSEASAHGRDSQFQIVAVNSATTALEQTAAAPPDVVVTDVQMPGLDGMELMARLLEMDPGIPVIFLTAYGSLDRAVAAVKNGAYHYFQKPLSDTDLFWNTISQAAAGRRALEELEQARRDLERAGSRSPLVGESQVWTTVIEAVARVAPLPSTVLITGETGTGKEVVARAIHNLSPRADRPFVAVSCVEFAETILEAELFGHEQGAFTGARHRRRGIFERAHRGTLFLDEIAETTPEMQAKLLRVIEGHAFHRVGGQTPLKVDFRLIAATNRDLNVEIGRNRFRQDLYFRLAVYPIQLPPLRDRVEDIEPLCRHFLKKTAHRLGRLVPPLSGRALALLVQHDWPGNVRELENSIERAAITCTGPELMPHDFFPAASPVFNGPGGMRLEDMERLFIQAALERSKHNKTQAAEILGIVRKTLADKMNKYNIPDHGEV
jgi:DNA-binding NtrC family response regulator